MAGGLYCPHCGSQRFYSGEEPYQFTCQACNCIVTIFNGHLYRRDVVAKRRANEPKNERENEKVRTYLITLTSPLALRLADGSTKLSNVVEADFATVPNRTPGTKWIKITRVFDHETGRMRDVGAKPIAIQIKETNIRCSQEVE